MSDGSWHDWLHEVEEKEKELDRLTNEIEAKEAELKKALKSMNFIQRVFFELSRLLDIFKN